MFVLPDLPYDYKALEPFIDEETMRIHHDKHHATYVKNLNDSLSGQEDLLAMDIEALLKNLDKVSENIRTKVRNNGGGVANHNMFWEIMAPAKDQSPIGEISEAIIKSFGSFDEFKKQFSEKALGRFGSGWVWLLVNSKGSLAISDTPNQDSPLMDGSGVPILCLDVWEHAYYLKYKNVRADYVNAWWNVVNWIKVEELYKKAGDEK